MAIILNLVGLMVVFLIFGGLRPAFANVSYSIVAQETQPPMTPGQPIGRLPTNNQSPVWSWQVSLDSDNEPVQYYQVEWSVDPAFSFGIHLATVKINSFVHISPLPEATWYLRVKARDRFGNYSEYSKPGSVTIDKTAPTVPGKPATDREISPAQPQWYWQ